MTTKSFPVFALNGQELFNNTNPLHPGFLIGDEMEARGLQKQDVAEELSIKPGHLSELIKEKRHVGAMLALKLEQLFGIDADYWLRVQSGYDLACARNKMQRENL